MTFRFSFEPGIVPALCVLRNSGLKNIWGRGPDFFNPRTCGVRLRQTSRIVPPRGFRPSGRNYLLVTSSQRMSPLRSFLWIGESNHPDLRARMRAHALYVLDYIVLGRDENPSGFWTCILRKITIFVSLTRREASARRMHNINCAP